MPVLRRDSARELEAAARRHPPSVRAIHAQLRHEIVTLRLRPATRLSENELALRFGTSRAPVREALIRLADEGFIDIQPQRGSFVSRISLGAMRRARFVREAIEISVVRQAASQGLSAPLLLQLETSLADQVRALEDPEHFTLADDAFHRTLVEGIGIAQLWSVLEREKSQFDRVRFLSLPHTTPAAVLIDQHRAILSAIIGRDPAAAESAMRVHMSEVLKITQTLLDRYPDLMSNDD
ncbi:MAG TPA: GntR family transcriptional regulator [Pseudorhodoplanes sp.]|nr:GntR family transcriptional regulator [Pseudorhodoplanes sp.]